jgi:hypothetical protein
VRLASLDRPVQFTMKNVPMPESPGLRTGCDSGAALRSVDEL